MAQLVWGSNGQLRFKDSNEYYWTLGHICNRNFYTITLEKNSLTDSWSDAYRIRCLTNAKNLSEAFYKALRNGNRINCNDYVINLRGNHRFDFVGGHSNEIIGKYEEVKKTVPKEYLDVFEAGYLGKLSYLYGLRVVDFKVEIPEEVSNKESQTLSEGQKTTITVNSYERNPEARKRCLLYYYNKNGGKLKCEICGFSFGEKYGEAFKGKIHVHHKVEISSIGQEYVIDPEKDLLPVCPNCHMVIHSKKPAYTVDEVKTMIEENE